MARDSRRRHALLLRDELAFLEEVESGCIRDADSEKEKEYRLRQDARDWAQPGGPADELKAL